VERVAERTTLAQFELDAAPGAGRLEPDHAPLDRAALGRTAADHAADAIFRDEVEGALAAALDRPNSLAGERERLYNLRLS
jgi:hypothetical protein